MPRRAWYDLCIDFDNDGYPDGGVLRWGAPATPVWGDEYLVGPAVTRAAEEFVEFLVEPDLTTTRFWVGLNTDAVPGNVTGADAQHVVLFENDGTIDYYEGGTKIADVMAYSADTEYRVRVVLKAAGAYVVINDQRVLETDAGATATLYPVVSSYDGDFDLHHIRRGEALTASAAVAQGEYWDLDGTGDYLSHADHADFDITGALTVGGWFWLDNLAIADEQAIYSKEAAWRIDKLNGSPGSFRWITWSATVANVVTSSVSPTQGAWIFIVCRFNPSTEQSIFVNGIWTKDTTGIAASIDNSAREFDVARRDSAAADYDYMDGRAASFFICNAALSDIENASLYYLTRAMTEGDVEVDDWDQRMFDAYDSIIGAKAGRRLWIGSDLVEQYASGRDLTANGDAARRTFTLARRDEDNDAPDWEDYFGNANVDVIWTLNDAEGVVTETGGETPYVTQATVDRGRTSQISSSGPNVRSQDGRLSAVLESNDGRYLPENAAGPLFGDLLPGREAVLVAYDLATATASYRLFEGFIKSLKPDAKATVQDYKVELVATDYLGILKLQETRIALLRDQLTAAIIDDILDDVGTATWRRNLDAGQSTVVYAWAEGQDPRKRQSALQGILSIVGAENGFLYIDGAGRITFEDRHHRLKSPHTASQATFNDTMAQISTDYDLDDVYNDVKVVAHPMQIKAAGEIWRLRDTLQVEAGAVEIIEAEFRDPDTGFFAGGRVTTFPVPVGYFTFNANADGTGANLISNAQHADFEEGTTADFDSVVASPTATTASVRQGTYGMEITVSGTTAEYGQFSQTATGEALAGTSWNPNGVSVTATPLVVLVIRDGAQDVAYVELRDNAGQLQVRGSFIDDAGTTNGTWTNVEDDEWHTLAIWYKVATAAGANDGIFRFHLDGESIEDYPSNLDNDTIGDPTVSRYGMVSGGAAGNSGTMYFDDCWWLDGEQVACEYFAYGNRARILVHNNGGTTGHITSLILYGDPVVTYDGVLRQIEDATSQDDYQRRTLKEDMRFMQDSNVAQDKANYLLGQWKDPSPKTRITYNGHETAALMTQALTRDLSDRITVAETTLGINEDFFIGFLQHQIGPGGLSHMVTYYLESVDKAGSYWVLDTSELDTSTRLAY